MKTLAAKSASSNAWTPALLLSLSVCVCHGIGRFAYALILPAMQEDQRWTYEVASWLNTANALGYIAGAITCLLLLRVLSAAQVFRMGLCATACAVTLTGVGHAWWWLLTMRLVAGCGAAWTFAAGGAVVAAYYRGDPGRSSQASGIFFSGAGLGMALSAVIAPFLFSALGVTSWPLVWFVLGLVSVAAGAMPFRVSFGVDLARRADSGSLRLRTIKLSTYLLPTLAYLVFAFAHTVYVFFIFAWAKEAGVPWYLGASMWVLLGLGVLASPFLWQRPLRKWDPNEVLAACCLQTCIGATLPIVSASAAALFLSALLVGTSFFMAPTAVAVLVRESAQERLWATGISAFAVVFSLGQAAGSWATGIVADRFSLSHALVMGSVGLLLSAVVAFSARDPKRAAA